MSRSIAFFDFDGTITTKDTLLEFIRFTRGEARFWAGFIRNSPWLLAYKLKLISNQSAKEKVLRHFFRDTPVSAFREQCDLFYDRVLGSLIRPKALVEIQKLKREGVVIVIVWASPENWIRGRWEEIGAELIARRLEVKEDRITGKILGKNCYGAEKVRRIGEKYAVSDYEVIHAYGDTSGDLPMLKLATTSYYKPFRN